MNKEYVLLLTGTIKPFDKVSYLKVKNPELRKKQYKETILYYIKKHVSNNIVFCENSNQNNDDDLYEIESYAKKNNVNFEYISFQGSRKTVELGKSFGEAEIIDYAVGNSKLLRRNKYFIKVTGRIIISNLIWLIKIIKPCRSYFVTYGNEKIEMVDTRCFCMSISEYRKHFMYIFENNSIEVEISLEQLYAEALVKMPGGYSSMPIRLNYVGVSGGQGGVYKTDLSDIIKDSIKKMYYTKLGQRVFIEHIGLFQSDMMIPEKVWVDNFTMLERKRIVICGAAMYGCWFFHTARKKTKIIGWADKSYKTLKRIMDYPIESYECVLNRKFDYIAIAVYSDIAFGEIKKYLLNKGINENKIINVGEVFKKEMGR